MRPNRSIPSVLFLTLLPGCAGGARTGEAVPVRAGPAEMPIEWFAEAWGPFEASWTEAGAYDDRPRSLTTAVARR